MSLTFFNNYLDNIAKPPSENYRSLQQAFVNRVWFDSTLLEIVEEETFHGSGVYEEIPVWKNSIGEFTVQISKNEKDYRRLMFKDQSHVANKGLMYKFEDNYYICYDPTSDIEPYAEVYVRRCNNWLKWVDKETGEIYKFPCVLDYEVSSPTPQRSKTAVLPNSHIVLWVQANDITRKIKKNQRFIFGGDPYKFTAYNAYLQNDYVDELVPMYFMDLYLDEIQPTDDIENNIANLYEFEYEISISQENFTRPKGSIGNLYATVTLNGDTVERFVEWESLNENIIIQPTGEYELVGENGTQGIVRAYIGSNKQIYDEITININEGLGQKELVFEPLYEEIGQNETIKFSVNVYIDGVKQNEEISIRINQSGGSCDINRDGNNFEITSNKVTKIPLSITFFSEDISETREFKLTSLF